MPPLRNPVQVTSALDIESYPTWSPDGQRLAYQANDVNISLVGNNDIWVAQLGGGEPVNLTRDSPASNSRPSWSPSGHGIAFFSDRDGEWGVYVVAAIGGSPRKVLALPGFNELSWSAPQWARDEIRLFVAANDGNRNIIIDLALATLEVTRIALPEHASPRRWDVTIRPDGARFAYLEANGGSPELSRLWTVDASGHQPISLTDGMTNVWSPSWSNDGRQISRLQSRRRHGPLAAGRVPRWHANRQSEGGDKPGVGIRSAAFSPDEDRSWRIPERNGLHRLAPSDSPGSASNLVGWRHG